MRDRCDQGDMAHSVSAHFGRGDFDATLFTDDTFVTHLFVFTAKTLIVPDRSEDFGTEESISFGLQGAVIDRLRLFDFTVTPGEYLLRTGNTQLQCGDILGSLFAVQINRC